MRDAIPRVFDLHQGDDWHSGFTYAQVRRVRGEARPFGKAGGSMTTSTKQEKSAFADAMMLMGALIVAVGGLLLSLASREAGMAFHGLLFLVAGLVAAVVILQVSFQDATPLDADAKFMDGPIKVATIAAVIWGIAGFVVGDVIAWQLAFPQLNLDLPWTSFGRLRPLHTSAVIFAFGGNVLIATSLYVVQRTCHARMPGRWAPWFVVWGYQLFIVIAGTGYLLGITQSKEYAEPEWYADLWLTIVWVVYLGVFLGTSGQAQRAAHLRGELVLSRFHRHHRDAAPRQQRGHPRQSDEPQELHRLFRRAGCDDAMVVRAQRRRLLPDRRLSRHHVLLHPEAGRAAGLFLPPVDRAFLDADLSLHLGRARTICTTPRCPTGRRRSA